MDINEMARLSLSSDIDDYIDRRREAEDRYEQSLIDLVCPFCQYEFQEESKIKFPECPTCREIFER